MFVRLEQKYIRRPFHKDMDNGSALITIYGRMVKRVLTIQKPIAVIVYLIKMKSMKKMSFIFLLSFVMLSGDPYGFTLHDLSGNPIKLSSYSGKKILIVNTASQSPYQNQYDSLELLAEKNQSNLVIIAVPSNSFNNEPNDNATIAGRLKVKNLHFIVCSKTSVAGSGQDSLFQWISRKDLNGMGDCTIKADFQKFLIDEHGVLMGFFAPSVSPLGDEVKRALLITN